MRSHDVAATNAWVLAHLPDLLVAVMLVVLMPLAAHVARAPRWLVRGLVPAGLLAGIGMVAYDAGVLATITVAPYAALTIAAGVIGLRRVRDLPRFAVNAGLMMMPAAAAWLVAARAGYALLAYPPFWVILTAAHFHVAGVTLMIVAGTIAESRGRIARVVALATVVCVPLTAAGIYGPHWLELGAAVAMATSTVGVALLLVTTKQLPLRIAGGVLLVTMPLAGAFALRDHGTAVTLFGLEPLASMMLAHGLPNALVFGILALATLSRRPAAPPA